MKNLIYYFILTLLLITCNNKDIIDEVDSTNDDIMSEQYEGVIEDNFYGINIALYANSELGIIVGFNELLDNGTLVSVVRSSLNFPDVFISTEGTVWNIFGEAVDGPLKGNKMKLLETQMGYWFAFGAFYPKVTLMGETNQERILSNYSNPEWLINPENIISGAIKNGIPSIDNPIFIEITNNNCSKKYYVNDDELVAVVKNDNIIKVYPYKILDWHEIVNDEINGVSFSLSYCPLTGTSDAWIRTIHGITTTFGVSGLLVDNNLILYDRETDSLWPQILKLSIYGSNIGEVPNRIQITEMTWAAAKQLSCNLSLLSDNTGFSRAYNVYPYGNYKRTDELLFPISYEDSRVFLKEKVLNLLVDNKAKVYRFNNFDQ